MVETSAQSPKRSQRVPLLSRMLLASLAACGIGLLSFPYWSPLAVKPLASILAGAQIESVTRNSDGTWLIENIGWSSPGASIQAASVRLPSPTRLLLQFAHLAPVEHAASAIDWSVRIAADETAVASDDTPAAFGDLLETLRSTLRLLGKHVSAVEAQRGSVYANSQLLLGFPRIRLDSETLTVEGSAPSYGHAVTLSASDLQSEAWEIGLSSPTLPVGAKMTLDQGKEEIQVRGTLTSSGNRLDLDASWAAGQAPALPQRAHASANTFVLDDRYSFWTDGPALEIAGELDWQSGAHDFRMRASLAESETGALSISGSGTATTLQIDEIQSDLPWLKIESHAALAIGFNKKAPLQDTEIEARIDLSKIPNLAASGRAKAKLQSVPKDSAQAHIRLTFEAADIQLQAISIARSRAELLYGGDSLWLKNFVLESPGGSSLAAKGSIDTITKQIQSAQLRLALADESALLQGLGAKIGWQSVNADFQLSGDPQNPEIEGKLLCAALQLEGLEPLDVEAQVSGLANALRGELLAQCIDNRIDIDLLAAISDQQIALEFQDFTLSSPAQRSELALVEDFNIDIHTSSATLRMSPLALADDAGPVIELKGLTITPNSLQTSILANRFDTQLLEGWLAKPPPPLTLHTLETHVTIKERALSFASSGSASWQVEDGEGFELSWQSSTASDKPQRIALDSLSVAAGETPIFEASGSLPVSVARIGSKFEFALRTGEPVSLALDSKPNPRFWSSAQTYLPVTVANPRMSATLSGTLAAPKGSIQAEAEQLAWREAAAPHRSLELRDIKLSVAVDPSSIALDSLEAHSGGNSISAKAMIPITRLAFDRTDALLEQINWEELRAEGNVLIHDMDTLSAWLPDQIRAQGKVDLSVDISPNSRMAVLRLENIATRPMPPLSGLSDIGGQLAYRNGRVEVDGLAGKAEGNPFQLVGSVNLDDIRQPDYDLSFTAQEFPIARDNGLLVSGSIDIGVQSAGPRSTIVSGAVDLQKGLFLIEPDLLANSTKTAQSSPPFFAVEQAPFNSWELDVRIEGEEFMRVANSYFEGSLSADFQLEGTLGAPLLIGSGFADAGQIYFPASSLNLSRGQAIITREDPNTLQIEAAASGRMYGYDINLDAVGPIENPDISITTNPAMTQVEALLLVTTGTLPDSGGALAQNSATSLGMFIGKGLLKKLSGGNSDTASRLSLEVGQDISLQGKKTVEATYQLTETLETQGEYDKRDEFNANLIWTFFRK